MLHNCLLMKAIFMKIAASMAIIALVTATPTNPVCADQSTIESVRLQVIQVANELGAIPLDVSDYDHIAVDLESLKQNVGALRPQTNQLKIVESLRSDVQELSDAFRVWTYARQHNPFPENPNEFNLAHLPSSDPLYSDLKAKYSDNIHLKLLLTSQSPFASMFMSPLIITAKSDAAYLVNNMEAAATQGNGSLKVNYPLTAAEAAVAIQIGSRTNEDALSGREMEWRVEADRNNEAGVPPYAIIETPFFKVARLAANLKAKYESAPRPAVLARIPEMKVLTTDMYLESKSLHAFDDSVCVIKQGDSIVHATSRSVSHPSVTDQAYYAYDVYCDFPMTKFNPSAPYSVTLANVTIFDLDNAQVRKGELNFNVNPLRMR